MKIQFLLFPLMILLLFACKEEQDLVQLNTANESWHSFVMDINLPNTNDFYEPDWDWKFFVGEDTGWEISGLPKFTDYEKVKFPHRFYQPNAAFWYQTSITEKYDQPKWLYINGDDGSQVFKGNQRIKAENGFFYFVGDLNKGDVLTFRIMNNAANGGVRSLRAFNEETADQLFSEIQATYQTAEKVYLALQYLPEEYIHDAENTEDLLAQITNEKLDSLSKLPGILKFPWLTLNEDQSFSLSFKAANSDLVQLALFPNSSSEPTFIEIKERAKGVFTTNLNEDQLKDVDHYYIYLDNQFKSGPFKLNTNFIESPITEFVFWADCQGGWNRFDSIVHQINEVNPQIQVGLGDYASNGYFRSQWHQFFHFGSPIFNSRPGIFIPGNHDYDGYFDYGKAELLNKYLLNDQHSTIVDYQIDGTYLVGVDLNTQFPIGALDDSKTKEQLESIFSGSEWKNANWRVLLIHQPVIGESSIGYGGEESSREIMRLANIFQSVDLVISGHNHRYERGVFDHPEMGKFMQLTVGGAGRVSERPYTEKLLTMDTLMFRHHFAHLKFDKDQISAKIIGTDGSVLDEFNYSKN